MIPSAPMTSAPDDPTAASLTSGPAPTLTLTDPETPPGQPPVAYGRIAAHGMAWVGISAVVGKAASFVAQIALGYLLTRADFALFATAVAFCGIFLSANCGGVHKILVQRGEEVDQLAGPLFRLALLINGLIALALLVAAPFAARFYHEPHLVWLIAIMATFVLLGTPSVIQTYRLNIGLQLSTTARIAAASSVLRQGSSIVFGLARLGAASLALPMIVASLFEWVATARKAGPIPRGRPLTRALAREVLMSSRWIIFGTLAIAFSINGDYLVIGRLKDKDVLGVYFFGFQLTVSIAAPFATTVLSVLAPTLAKLKEPERRRRAYLRATRLLAFVAAPPCVAMALLAFPAVHIIWRGKWDASVPVSQVMALTLIIALFVPLATATYEAYGYWRLRAALLVADGAGVVVSAAIGCHLGSTATIAICVGLNRLLIGVIQGVAAARVTGTPALAFLRELLPPILTVVAAGVAVHLLFTQAFPLHNPWLLGFVEAASFGLLLLALALTALRPHFTDALEVTGLIRRIPASVVRGFRLR